MLDGLEAQKSPCRRRLKKRADAGRRLRGSREPEQLTTILGSDAGFEEEGCIGSFSGKVGPKTKIAEKLEMDLHPVVHPMTRNTVNRLLGVNTG